MLTVIQKNKLAMSRYGRRSFVSGGTRTGGDRSQAFFEDQSALIRLCLERQITVVHTSVVQSTNVTEQSTIYLRKPVSSSDLSVVIAAIEQAVLSKREKQHRIAETMAMFQQHNHGEWQRGKCIGKGAYGAVYLATSLLTKGVMAVKVPTETQR
eukprot:PhM_4_TR13940/c0_g1_i4/m.5329